MPLIDRLPARGEALKAGDRETEEGQHGMDGQGQEEKGGNGHMESQVKKKKQPISLYW